MKEISQLTVHRLILYRKLLKRLKEEDVINVFSYKLASLAGRTQALVRRDLMVVGYSGTPVHGYNIEELIKALNIFLDKRTGQEVALIGFGNLGRAIIDYCSGLNSKLIISAAFDVNPSKINRVISGVPCFHIDNMESIIKQREIEIAILAMPSDSAQKIADRLVRVGINAFLNYTSARLHVPANIFVENRDMMMALEKAAYFARIRNPEKKIKKANTEKEVKKIV
jgi:redox-sensing transcriptional repressor